MMVPKFVLFLCSPLHPQQYPWEQSSEQSPSTVGLTWPPGGLVALVGGSERGSGTVAFEGGGDFGAMRQW